MTERSQIREERYNLAGVPGLSAFPGRAHARNRRGPVKRVVLVVGPFFFLVAAVALSAGGVEIVARPPADKPASTLAEERAMAARAPAFEPAVNLGRALDVSTPSRWAPKTTSMLLASTECDPGQRLAVGVVSGAEVGR